MHMYIYMHGYMDIWKFRWGDRKWPARKNAGGATESGRRERMRPARKNAGGATESGRRERMRPARKNAGGPAARHRNNEFRGGGERVAWGIYK
jgi:hypothetical protein